MVEVTVGEQDRSWAEPVLAAYLGDTILDPDARVDDQALLPRCNGEDVAVGREGRRGEPDGQHVASLTGRRAAHRHAIVTGPAHGDLRGCLD
jgi:hypothetical protein